MKFCQRIARLSKLLALQRGSSLLAALLMLAPICAVADCGVATSGLNFGSYDVFNNSHTDIAGNVTVSCTAATPYSLQMSPGSGTFSERLMLGSNHNLAYNLYTDAARSQVWGDGSGGSATVSGNTDSSAQHTIYGRIPARQNVQADAYGDAIVITLEY